MKITLSIHGPEGSKSINLEVSEGTKIKDVLEASVNEGHVDPAMIEEPRLILIGRRMVYPEDVLREGDSEITIMRFVAAGG